jgi:putative flippase GtrA
MGKLLQQILKFGVVGVIATGIDFGILFCLTEFVGIDPVVSAAFSFTGGLIFNYVASMRFVFTHKQGLTRRREFLIFLALSLVGLAINQLVMWLGVDFARVNYLLVKVLATAIVMCWNFLSRKRWLDAGSDAPSGS